MTKQNIKSGGSFRRIVITSGIVVGIIGSIAIAAIVKFVLSPPPVNLLPVPANAIALKSKIGQQLLDQSTIKADYTSLSQNFQTQKLPAYCGVASGVMVLNAFKRTAPPLNQDTFFTPEAQKIRTPLEVAFLGMSLAQLAALLKSHQVKVETHYAADTTIEQFRTQIKQNLTRERDFVIVNYNRAGLNQGKGGHISPLSAYHEQSDRVLVEDVSSYKYPPVWVSMSELWNAVNTKDTSTGQTRGYLLVSQ
jgi:Phytochelatin synthase